MRQAGAVRGPTYKGNVGNLMQHWTLCEILTSLAATQRGASHLSYVDAHAMAPGAVSRPARNDKSRQTFDRVRDGLPVGSTDERSIYEQSWRRLNQEREGYPNSAAFVADVWKDRVSMLLCERDPDTAAQLDAWARHRNEVTVFTGDWRERFEEGLPDASLTLVSFDPYMYNRRCNAHSPDEGCLYPSDLERTVDALDAVQGRVLVQLSTYDTNDDNPQGAVISSVNTILVKSHFCLAAVVRVNGKMMSLVYVRGIEPCAEFADMPGRFRRWLATHQ